MFQVPSKTHWLTIFMLSLFRLPCSGFVLNVTRAVDQQDEFSNLGAWTWCHKLNATCATVDCSVCKCVKSHATFRAVKELSGFGGCEENSSMRRLFGCQSTFLSSTGGPSSPLTVLSLRSRNRAKTIMLKPFHRLAAFTCSVDEVHYIGDQGSLERSDRNAGLDILTIPSWPYYELKWGKTTGLLYSGRVLKVSVKCVSAGEKPVRSCIVTKAEGTLSYNVGGIPKPPLAAELFMAGIPIRSTLWSIDAGHEVVPSSFLTQHWSTADLVHPSSFIGYYQVTTSLLASSSATSKQRFAPTPSLLHPKTSISSRVMYSTTGSVFSTLPGSPSQRISPTGLFDARSTFVLSTMKPSQSATVIVASDQPTQSQFLSWWPWSKQMFTASVACVAVLFVLLVCLFITAVRCFRASSRKAHQSNLKVAYTEDQSPIQKNGDFVSLEEHNELEMTSVKSSESLRGHGAARETPGNGRVSGISNTSFLPSESEIPQTEEHYMAMVPSDTSEADTVKDDQPLLNAWGDAEQIYENAIDAEPTFLCRPAATSSEGHALAGKAVIDDKKTYTYERLLDEWPPTENQDETYSYANKECLFAEFMKANLAADQVFSGNAAAQSRPRTWVPVGRSRQSSRSLVPRARSCDPTEKHLEGPRENQERTKDSRGQPTQNKEKSEPVDRRETKAFDALKADKKMHYLAGTEENDSGCSKMSDEKDTPLYQNVGSLFQSGALQCLDLGPGNQAVESERASEEEPMCDEVAQCCTHGSPGQIYENLAWN